MYLSNKFPFFPHFPRPVDSPKYIAAVCSRSRHHQKRGPQRHRTGPAKRVSVRRSFVPRAGGRSGNRCRSVYRSISGRCVKHALTGEVCKIGRISAVTICSAKVIISNRADSKWRHRDVHKLLSTQAKAGKRQIRRTLSNAPE